MYELALERDRRAAAPTPLRGRSGGGSPAFVGRVATATASVAVGKYLLVDPVTVLGSESEGSAGSLSVGTSTVPVYLIGPGTPSNGEDLVCRWVGYRWAATRAGSPGGGGVTLSGCACTTAPATLTVANANASSPPPYVDNHTLLYGTRPAAVTANSSLAAQTTDPGFFSTSAFSDVLGSYYYTLACHLNVFTLSKLYYSGSNTGVKAIAYTWNLSNPSNTCSPFLLASGTDFTVSTSGTASTAVTVHP